MLDIKKTYFVIFLVVTICIPLVSNTSLWAKPDTGIKLNLTSDQIDALETVIAELNEKQFQVSSNIERTFLELKLELRRQDRFATEAKAAESSRKANKLAKKLTSLYGDMLKIEVAYVLKTKDVLTKEQRMQLIESLDFEMEIPEGLLQLQEIEVLVIDLELSDEQLKQIVSYRTKIQKKEAKITQEMRTILRDLEDELSKNVFDDKKVNKVILNLIDMGVDYLNDLVKYRLKAKDVLTVEQKKKLLQILFMATGF